MKKATLCLSLLLAGASAFAATPTTMPEVSTSRDEAKLYTIVSYRGDNAGGASILNGTELEGGVTTVENEVPETAMWYFTAGPEEGSFYVCNYGLWDSAYPEDMPALKSDWTVQFSEADGTPFYILTNGVNENGLVISSTNPPAGTSCLDKFNGGAGVSGGWNPSETDWEGTTWMFVAVDLDATSEENWAAAAKAWSDVHAGPIKSAALESLDALVGSNPWSKADFEAAKTEVEALASPTQDEVNAIIVAAMDKAVATVNTEIVGKTFSLQGVRANAQGKVSFLGTKDLTIAAPEGSETETIDIHGLASFYEAYSYCWWTAVKAEGGFKLQNMGTKAYIATLSDSYSKNVTTTENEADAAVFTASFFGGQYAGVTFPSKVATVDAEGNETTIDMAINIDPQGVGMTYMPADAGSTFTITVGDPAGIQAVEIENANGAVEFYNIQGIRVNPETAGPGLYIRRQGNKAVKVLVR